MTNVLIPVDGSESSLNAVKKAIHWGKKSDWSLHIINVQPPLVLANPALYVAADTIEEYYREAGLEIIAQIKPLLDASGVKYKSTITTGSAAHLIADYAKENDIDQIIMGTRGLGAVSGLFLGSVTTKIITLVDIPVTLIK